MSATDPIEQIRKVDEIERAGQSIRANAQRQARVQVALIGALVLTVIGFLVSSVAYLGLRADVETVQANLDVNQCRTEKDVAADLEQAGQTSAGLAFFTATDPTIRAALGKELQASGDKVEKLQRERVACGEK